MEDEEKDNNIDTSSKMKKKNKLVKIIYVVLIFITFFAYLRYARYKETYNGAASAKIAKMICEMDVVPSENNKSLINPYCNVTVRNYDEDNNVAETDINYKIQVIPKDDLEDLEYYWKDSEGTKVAESTELTGSFVNGVKDEAEYTIVFLNSGDKDINRSVEFKLIAVQAIIK